VMAASVDPTRLLELQFGIIWSMVRVIIYTLSFDCYCPGTKSFNGLKEYGEDIPKDWPMPIESLSLA